MTRYQILQDLKALIGPGPQATDSQLIVWINNTYNQVIDSIIASTPDYFTKASTASSVTGQQEYGLPSDFIKLIMVNIQTDGDWKRVTPLGNGDIRNIPVQADTSTDQGYSSDSPRYYLFGDTIGFMPIPQETTSNNIKLWYTFAPDELSSDSSEPEIPKQLHHYLAVGAYSYYLDLMREHVAAERMRTRFDVYVERFCQNIADRSTDETKSVLITDGELYQNGNTIYEYN